MTDMQHKPNGWNEPLNQMTEDEWKEYFRLREELDVEMSDEEVLDSLKKVNMLLTNHKEKEAQDLMAIIPVDSRLAYFWKKGLGLKEVMYLNLSEAKRDFPNEF